MKSKDIPVLILVVGIAVLASYFASNLLLGKVGSQTTQVEVIDPISANFDYENKPYYLPNPVNPALTPLNPTKDITIDENNNQNTLQ